MSSASREPRKIRILAIHGGASNSNIMKFQTGPLRKLLGGDVEWLFPDGSEPWQPVSESNDEYAQMFIKDPSLSFYYAPRSPFEERLAQGKPFVAWFKIVSYGQGPAAEKTSFERAVARLDELVAKEAPIDVMVCFSQGSIIANSILSRALAAGRPSPWRLSVYFSPTPTPAGLVKEHKVPFPEPAFIITSPLDPAYPAFPAELRFYGNVEVLEHTEGLAFPAKPPKAAEIYERIASEIRKCSGLAAPAEVSVEERKREWAALVAKYSEPKATWSAATAAASQPRFTAAGSQTVAPQPAEVEEEEDEVQELLPAALADMLLENSCVVVDIERQRRGQPEHLRPGVEAEDLSFVSLQMMPAQARKAIRRLQEASKIIVAASATGEQCEAYCEALTRHFGLKAEQLKILAGGFRAWDSWELEHPQASSAVRAACGKAPLFEESFECVEAEALAELLTLGACVVVDARELQEARRRAFPGAVKDLSLISLRRKKAGVKEKLAALREDGRPLVSVSNTGLRCRSHCSLLVREFGIEADKVCWLKGGVCEWEDWEREHQESSNNLRRLLGQPSLRPREHDAGRAAELREHSLDLLR